MSDIKWMVYVDFKTILSLLMLTSELQAELRWSLFYYWYAVIFLKDLLISAWASDLYHVIGKC